MEQVRFLTISNIAVTIWDSICKDFGDPISRGRSVRLTHKRGEYGRQKCATSQFKLNSGERKW